MSTSAESKLPVECAFLVPRDLPGPSGGTRYNNEVIAALLDAGHRVQVHKVPGAWPRPTASDRVSLRQVMLGYPQVVVDGIMALAAPEEVEAAVRHGSRVHILVHSLLSADPGLDADERASFTTSESAALRAATTASVVSWWSARDVMSRCPDVRVDVASPGTSPATRARGSEPPQLLVLAALTPGKNQALVLEALSHARDLPWAVKLVGSQEIDPDYVNHLQGIVGEEFEQGRVTLTGSLTGASLDEVWEATDLLLLTSTSETFGMVVTEAHARGIPAVVTGNTGAVEALMGGDVEHAPAAPSVQTPGAVVDPLDATDLAATMRRWLTDPDLRMGWQAAALARRSRLRTWNQTAAELARLLQA